MALLGPDHAFSRAFPSRGGASSDNDNPTSPPARHDGFWIASLAFPVLADWVGVLRRLGISPEEATDLACQAAVTGSDFASELAGSGMAAEAAFIEALAAETEFSVLAAIEPDSLMIRDQDCVALLRDDRQATLVRIACPDGTTAILLAPKRLSPAGLRHLRRLAGTSAWRLRLVAPGMLRKALMERARPVLSAAATNGLFERLPEFSARIVANAWQGSVLGAAIVALPLFAVAAPGLAFGALHVFSSMFLLACVALRVAALRVAAPPAPTPLLPVDLKALPGYTVLVALYRETDLVPDLLANLDRLQWPRDRLDVKLVCEADDRPTLAAIEAHGLPRGFEVVAVPPSSPRTKPKALAYALPLARGDYVVLYDAEDEPHPMQLLEAWSVFSNTGPELACLQAPLDISNAGESMLARLFAFEYSALFRGLLPYLSQRRRLLPLGGTSNHFRRAVLEEVGGWDPYNVTEDADLGLRLARFGYRTATTTLPTREAAPTEFRVWLPQRTRWFKGWVQSWLVHMRRPGRLARDLGLGSWIIAQILFAGMFVSAFVHPVLVASAIWLGISLALQQPFSTWQSGLLALDIANISCAYASFLLLGRQTRARHDRKAFWRIVLFTPIYWMMVSVAAWRALGQLWSRPHHWEKTPHKRQSRDASSQVS